MMKSLLTSLRSFLARPFAPSPSPSPFSSRVRVLPLPTPIPGASFAEVHLISMPVDVDGPLRCPAFIFSLSSDSSSPEFLLPFSTRTKRISVAGAVPLPLPFSPFLGLGERKETRKERHGTVTVFAGEKDGRRTTTTTTTMAGRRGSVSKGLGRLGRSGGGGFVEVFAKEDRAAVSGGRREESDGRRGLVRGGG